MPYYHEPNPGRDSEGDYRNWAEPEHEAWKFYLEATEKENLMRLRSGWLLYKRAWEKCRWFQWDGSGSQGYC